LETSETSVPEFPEVGLCGKRAVGEIVRRRLVSLALILMLVSWSVAGLISIGGVRAEEEVSAKRALLRAYQIAISKVASRLNLSEDLREKVKEVLSINVSSLTDPAELDEYIREAKGVLKELRQVAVEALGRTAAMERAKKAIMRRALERVEEKLKAMNASAPEEFEEIQEMLKREKLEEARKRLLEVVKEVELREEAGAARRFPKALGRMFHSLEAPQLLLVLNNLNRTMDVLNQTLVKLRELNASEECVEAVESAIHNLKMTIGVLSGVMKAKKGIPVGEMRSVVVNASRRILISTLSERIESLKERIFELSEELSEILEEAGVGSANVTEVEELVERANATLRSAELHLNNASEFLSSGKLGEAMEELGRTISLVNRAETLTKLAERRLEGIEGRPLEAWKLSMLEMRVLSELISLKLLYEEASLLGNETLVKSIESINATIGGLLAEISTTFREAGNYTGIGGIAQLLSKLSGTKEMIEDVKIGVRSALELLREGGLEGRVTADEIEVKLLNATCEGLLKLGYDPEFVEDLRRELNQALVLIEGAKGVSSSSPERAAKALSEAEKLIRDVERKLMFRGHTKKAMEIEEVKELKEHISSLIEEIKEEWAGVKGEAKHKLQMALSYLMRAEAYLKRAYGLMSEDAREKVLELVSSLIEKAEGLIEEVAG